jgi:uncharacterized integral membrane protein (TIGR00697 family)
MKDTKTGVSPLLVTLVVTFVSFMVMSNILANHMLQIWKWSLDAGTLTFPITYILSDVMSEVYGYKWSRRVTWMAATMTLIFSLLIALACALPQPEWYDGSHFAMALRSSFRIVLGSVIAYMSGDFINDRVFRRMKKAYPCSMKGFKLRAIVSSVCGNAVDSTIFVCIAFIGAIPAQELVGMICTNIAFKTVYEALILPVTTIVTQRVAEAEGNITLSK